MQWNLSLSWFLDLKAENEIAAANKEPRLAISRHLPDELRQERQALVPALTAARNKNQKASIRIDWTDLKMYLHVDNVQEQSADWFCFCHYQA